jgi:hypothetical protein
MLKKALISILTLVTFSCKENNSKLIETAAYPDLKEERLGQSPYRVKIPSTMFIEEARGKEGQLGYGLWQIDSISRYTSSSAFIEIEHGRPIGGGDDGDIPTEKISSTVLGKTANWRIMRTETGYYIAVSDPGKLSLRASSPTRGGLDSMIAIVSTLSTQ